VIDAVTSELARAARDRGMSFDRFLNESGEDGGDVFFLDGLVSGPQQ